VTLQKYFSHPSLVIYFFATTPMKKTVLVLSSFTNPDDVKPKEVEPKTYGLVKEDKTEMKVKKDANSKKHMPVLSMGSEQWRWAVFVLLKRQP
jgi:hypothetical protein